MSYLIWKLSLRIILAIAFSSVAYANEQCQQTAYTVSEDFSDSVESIYANQTEVFDELSLRAKKFQPQIDVEDIENIFNIYKEKYWFDENKDKYHNVFPQLIIESPTHKDRQSLCDTRNGIAEHWNKYLSDLEKNIDTLNNELKSHIDLLDLRNNQGYAVISINKNFNSYSATFILESESFLGGELRIGPLNNYRYLTIHKLNIGEYYWDRVNLKGIGNTKYYFDIKENEHQFTVKPNKINFTGQLLFQIINNKGFAEISERSSYVLDDLESKYPYLSKKYRLTNGFSINDPFLDFYKSERKASETE